MTAALLSILFLTAQAEPVEYKLQPGGSNRLTLEVEKTGLMKGKKHIFEFPQFQGKITLDLQNPSNSKVDLRIDAASITCKDTWLGPKDLKKVLDYAQTDMLNVKRYPEMRFVSTKITAKGNDSFDVEGTLNIRGNGKTVTLNVTLDQPSLRVSGKAVFKLTAYGMKPPSAGLVAIGTKDDVTALFQVLATK
ncbi:MAG: YceI family protein [Candidatus Solibacter usitatus]|nr:YceI family protein [Candidatus Solibacter usitatus]